MATNKQRRSFLKKVGLVLLGTQIVPADLLAEEGIADLPHYVPHISEKTDLRKSFLEGSSLVFQGKLLSETSRMPISNATVEVWHCNSKGQYGYKAYRGKATTDSRGRYRFKTILPGQKKENGGKKMRRVHVLVKAKGYKSQFFDLLLDSKGYAYIDGNHWGENKLAQEGKMPQSRKFLGEQYVMYNQALVTA